MAGDDPTPLDDELDPTADAPAPEAEEPAAADDTPGSDPETRLAEAQGLITRQQQELALFRGKASQPEESAAGETTSSDDFLARATQDSWTLAEKLYGEQAIDAYRTAQQLLDRAATPADYMAAFEAYHDIRSGKADAKPEAGAAVAGKTRAEAIQPRVDANRSDPGPDLSNADEKLSEARKAGSLDKFASAAAALMGFGPSRS